MLRMVARYGDDLRRLTLRPEVEVTVGSAEGNDFVLPFPGVSRKHARAGRTPEGVRLVDLDSKNGLVVGGRRLREMTLHPGESVLLGRALIFLETVADEDLELALVLDEPQQSPISAAGARRWRAGETAPHWALHLVRELDELSPDVDEARRAEVLARTAHSIGADGLWTFAVVEGDYFLRDFAGAVPPDEVVAEVRELARETVARGVQELGTDAGWEPVELKETQGPVLVCPPPTGRGLLLVATFPASRSPAAWVADLMTHVAERLRSIEAGPGPNDIPALVRHFAEQAGRRYKKRIRGVGRGALERIRAQRWEGRLWMLEHAVAGAVLRCPEGQTVEAGHLKDLDDSLPIEASATEPEPDDTLVIHRVDSLAARLEAAERDALRDALTRAGGDCEKAAELLGITPEELAARLDRSGIEGA